MPDFNINAVVSPGGTIDATVDTNTATAITATVVAGAQGPQGPVGPTGPQGSPATNLVTSVASRIGDIVLTKSDVGLSNIDNTSDVNKPVSTAQAVAIALKVDKTTTVNGHALSSNVTVTADDVLPTQTGNSGKFLTTNGTDPSWGTPAGTGDMILAAVQTVTGAKTFNAGTLLDKGSVIFNVKAFGALGDGSTNDTTAIQAAITAASTAGGGIVYLPRGIYIVSGDGTATDGVFIIPPKTVFMGSGIGSTTIRLINGYSSDVTGIVRTLYNTSISDVTIRDMTIDGNGANVSGTPRIVGFYCGTTPGSTLSDYDIRCMNVEIMNCTGYGFDPHERTTRLSLLWCISHNNGYGGNPYDGFTLDGQYEALVVGCISYSNNRYGFNLTTASTNCTIVGCEAYSNGGGGITIANGSKFTNLSGCKFHDNTADGIFINGLPNSAVGAIDTTPGANNSIKGNEVTSSGSHGIHVYASSYNHISGNTVRDSSQTTTATYNQIMIDDNGSQYSTYNTIIDNDLGVTGLTNVPNYGIKELTSSDDNNFIVANRSLGASFAALGLLGTNSLALQAHNGINEHSGFISTTLANGTNITLGTGSGTEIGTASTQKLGFLGATPVIQQSATTDLGSVLGSFGLRATGGAYPITTSGAVKFTGTIEYPWSTRTSGGTLTAGTSAESQWVDATSGAITMNLAAVTTAGYRFYIIKIDSSANAITVSAQTGNLINGAMTYSLVNQYDYVVVESTTTSGVWNIVGANGNATDSSKLPLAGGTMTDGANIAIGTTTGTEIGTSTSQKLAFYGSTPVAQQGATTDLGTVLSTLGLRTSGTTYALTTSGAVAFSGNVKLSFASRTSSATLSTSSSYGSFADGTSGAYNITLPAAASSANVRFVVMKIDSSANAITVKGNASELINTANTYILTAQYQYVEVTCNGTQWYITDSTASAGGSGITRSVSSISANTSAGSTALTDYVYLCSGSITLTLPTAVGNTNRYTIKNTSTGTITIATTSSQTVEGKAATSIASENDSLDLVSDNANWRII